MLNDLSRDFPSIHVISFVISLYLILLKDPQKHPIFLAN
jgi:hypothetical protein